MMHLYCHWGWVISSEVTLSTGGYWKKKQNCLCAFFVVFFNTDAHLWYYKAAAENTTAATYILNWCMLFLDRRTLQLPRLWPQTWSHDSSGSSYIRLSVYVCVCVSTALQRNPLQTVCALRVNNKDDPCQLPICTDFPFYFYSVLLSAPWPFISTDKTGKWNWQLRFLYFLFFLNCWLKHSKGIKWGNRIILLW